MKSFFSAGGKVPWWISSLSLFMSFFSAGTFVVWGSIAYSEGWVSVAIQWTMAIAGLIIGFVIAPKWNKTGTLTVAEYITKRFGKDTQRVYTWLFLFLSLFTTGAFLYPVAKIVEVSTGIPITTSIIALGILITIYTAIGGLWAVIVTDVLQFVVLTAAVLIVVPLAFDEVGGIDGFVQQAPENFFNFISEEYSLSFMIAFGLYNLFFIAGNWAYVQRYTSVGTPKDAKKVGWLFGGLYVISPVLWMLPPMIYRALVPELSGLENEGAYLLMCKQVLPAGMLGLIVGGMVFATSSSVNTTLNIASGVFTNDVYKLLKPKTSQEDLMKIARLTTVLFGLITIVVALLVPKMGGIVELILGLAAVTGGAMYLPPLWSLFSKHQTKVSVLATTLISLIVNAYMKFAMPELQGVTLSRAMEMILGVGIPIALLAFFELYARFTNQAEGEHVVADLETDGSSEEEEAETNTHGVKVIAIGIGISGLLVALLGVINDEGRTIVISMGSAVMFLAAYVYPGLIRKTKN